MTSAKCFVSVCSININTVSNSVAVTVDGAQLTEQQQQKMLRGLLFHKRRR